MLTVQLLELDPERGGWVESAEYEVDYVSLVNNETFGPPPLIAPTKDRVAAKAEEGDKVLYINTNTTRAFTIVKEDDD